jgi:hypothetical protein
MRRAAICLVALVSALSVACSTMTVGVDYDHTINWSKYTTFQVGTGTPAPTTFTQKRIDNAITSTLQSKGWQAVTSNPSIMVYPHIVLSEQTQLNTMNMGGYGYRGWGGMGGMSTTTVQKIPMGTLVVDLVDPATKEMVWRGTATDQVSGTGEDQGKVDEAMQKLFADFPPGSGKK